MKMYLKKITGTTLTLGAALTIGINCSSTSGTVPDIPAVKPLIEETSPTGLKSTSSSSKPQFNTTGSTTDTLGSSVKSRFFNSGPTDIAGIAKNLDDRINSIKTRAAESERSCLSNTPVEMQTTILGKTVKIYAQCYDKVSDTGIVMFGKRNNTWYLYDSVGQTRSLFAITPSGNGKVGEGYMGVGYQNASSTSCSSKYDGCSYGMISVYLNSDTRIFEMGVAGIGFGFCGAHIRSDLTNLFIAGSPNGVGAACTAYSAASTDTHACFSASDLSSTALTSCTSIDIDNFFFKELMGKTALPSWNASNGWPASGNIVTLDGTTSDTIYFGWSIESITATAGISSF